MLDHSWNYAYIAFSNIVAYIGSYWALSLYEQYRICAKESRKISANGLLVLTSMTLGGVAIWCMHFVGMAAISYSNDGQDWDVRYRLDLTLVSFIIVIVACFGGLHVCSYDKIFTQDRHAVLEKFHSDSQHMTVKEIQRIRNKQYIVFASLFKNLTPLLIGGIITGTGVCAMHYIGMMAIVLENVNISWNIGIVAWSVFISLMASTTAFWIFFRLLSLYPDNETLRVACAFVMAMAVCGMHYTGMSAAHYTFQPNGSMTYTGPTISADDSVTGTLMAAAIFTYIVSAIAESNLRSWHARSCQVLREIDVRMVLCKNSPLSSNESFLLTYEEVRNAKSFTMGAVELKMRSSVAPQTMEMSTLYNNKIVRVHSHSDLLQRKDSGGTAAGDGGLSTGSRSRTASEVLVLEVTGVREDHSHHDVHHRHPPVCNEGGDDEDDDDADGLNGPLGTYCTPAEDQRALEINKMFSTA